MVLYYTRGSGNLGRNGFYQKEGVVDKEGNLRVSFGFGSMEVLGDFGRRNLCRRTRFDYSRMEATWEATRMSWACIWKGRVGIRARKTCQAGK